MHALQLTGFGEPAEVVTLVSQPALVAGRDEVVVAVEAAPVHPSDIRLIRGSYGVRPRLPAPLGAEGVGKVVEVGPGADRALLGHRVAILPTYEQGTWADHALVATRNIVAVSDEGDPQQLAMIGVNPITALLLLRLFGPLSEGDWIAQTGANSAVGQYVVSLGERVGIHTLNVVRSDEAATQVNDAGGEHVVIDGDDLPAQLQRMLGGQELALVLDSIGGPVVTELAHRLRYGGKVVSFGALSGQPTALDVRQDLIYRNVSHHGFWTFNWLTRAPRAEIDAAYQEIVALVTSGELSADIDSTFRLERYADALSRAEHYRRHGKVLFLFRD
jgi:NADPH:quinone reductase-like Zn-dependent oxidoreductase